MNGIQKWLIGLGHLLYPRLCDACRTPLIQQEQCLCLRCESLLPFTHFHTLANNESTQRLAGRFPFVKATSLAYFTEEGMLQHLLHQLKYQHKERIGWYLGRLLGIALQRAHWEVDVVMGVPLHQKKEALRGFNQSQLIGEGISEQIHTPLLKDAVIRVKNTSSQTNKSRQERIDNVKDAFAVKQAKAIEGKHILLIDDVLTTGATIEACATALLQVPNCRLSIATIGIAV